MEAIQLYRAGELTMERMEHIANGYRLNHDTQNAEKWYAQIVQESDNPLNLLYYAQALHSNGNLELARTYYLKYDQALGGSGDARGKNLAAAIDRISTFEHDGDVEVTPAKNINSPKLDFSPTYYQNGIVFVSNREPDGKSAGKDPWTGDDYAAHYFAREKADGTLAFPELFSLRLAGRFHEGPLTFTQSADQVFFTRNLTKKHRQKEYILKIFTAFATDSEWTSPEMLDLGAPTANDAHPALSPDGRRLYFASDREGGYGGMDIWVSKFENGVWGAPENAGAQINTAGNEVFPYVYEDGTLYFASDGWGGLGGLDIFYSNNENGTYGRAVNLGAPFNSNKDDFGYVLHPLGTEGYFTSARSGGSGKDDIYHFRLSTPQGNKQKKQKRTVPVCVTDRKTGERIAGAKVNVLTEAGDGSFEGVEGDFIVQLIPADQPDEYVLRLKRRDPFADSEPGNETKMTDENGQFDLEVRPDKQYIFVASANGYRDHRATFSPEALIQNDGATCLELAPAECVPLAGKTLNRRYENPVPNVTVTLVDLCSGETTTTISDENGDYAFSCLPCGCDFIVRASKVNFKEDAALPSTRDLACDKDDRLTQDLYLMPGYDEQGKVFVNFEDKTVLPREGKTNVSPPANPPAGADILREGVTFQLKDIYYDFDRANIRNPDAQTDLDHLVEVLRRHPDLRVELSSHTDSRGTAEYNLKLSENRARAAREYLIAHGIEPDRIIAKGYGESQPVNGCTDGVECSEAEHQLNRRTEVRVFVR